MFRSSPDTKQHTADTFTNIFNGLNMKCLQEMYLDTGRGSNSSPSTSPSSSATSETGSVISAPAFMPSYASQSAGTPTGLGVGLTIENLTALRQQQFLAAHQQQLLAAHQQKLLAAHQQQLLAAHHQHLAQRPLALAASVGNQQLLSIPGSSQQDEISKSLKMFAMLTTYSNNAESPAVVSQNPQSPVDAVMQDFACNGYISDELNRFKLGMHLSGNAATASSNAFNQISSSNGQPLISNGITNSNVKAAAIAAANSTLNQQQFLRYQQQNLNINFNNNFWKMFPNHTKQNSNAVTVAAAAAAAAVNIDYNCNQKKLRKRCGAKSEKYSSAKHCVFCENNNEAEAVVKSHSVRDSLGRVLCPKLRIYICPICKASGDLAHTVKYCPQKPIITMEDAIKAESFRLSKNTSYKQQMKV